MPEIAPNRIWKYLNSKPIDRMRSADTSISKRVARASDGQNPKKGWTKVMYHNRKGRGSVNSS
jgi:hypothetical protein